jgi:hypothetical protein
MNDRLEISILRNLINDEVYIRKTLPFIEAEYFTDSVAERTIFELTKEYFLTYNKLPTRETIVIEAEKSKNLNGDQLEEIHEIVKTLKATPEDANIQEWLLERTEKFCQTQAVTIAVFTAAQILGGSNKSTDIGSVPDLLSAALGISFDTHVGHDYINDADARYDFYHNVTERLPFHLSDFNEITNGGLPRKTLSVIMAGCVEKKTKIKVRIKKIGYQKIKYITT